MSALRVEHGDVDRWIIELDLAADQILPEAHEVIKKGSLNIKNDARRRASFTSTARHYPRTITYETRVLKNAAIGETGPRKDRPQGPLGVLLEFGTPTSPPQPHMGPAGDTEEPKFVRAMEALAAKLLEGR
jgi:hypothetical protein